LAKILPIQRKLAQCGKIAEVLVDFQACRDVPQPPLTSPVMAPEQSHCNMDSGKTLPQMHHLLISSFDNAGSGSS